MQNDETARQFKERVKENELLIHKVCRIYARIASIFFVILFEAVTYLQHFRMLHKLHALHVAVRLGAYTAFFLFIYFLSKAVNERKYGKHLNYLKTLVNEMQ